PIYRVYFTYELSYEATEYFRIRRKFAIIAASSKHVVSVVGCFHHYRYLHYIWISIKLGWAAGHLDLATCHHWSIIRIPGLCHTGITYTAGRLFLPVGIATGEP